LQAGGNAYAFNPTVQLIDLKWLQEQQDQAQLQVEATANYWRLK
jgi:hypothetical protein